MTKTMYALYVISLEFTGKSPQIIQKYCLQILQKYFKTFIVKKKLSWAGFEQGTFGLQMLHSAIDLTKLDEEMGSN